MYLSDFSAFSVFLLTLLLSFWAIYFALKQTGWSERGRMIPDTWKVWLTWLISTGAPYISFLMTESQIRFSLAAGILIFYLTLFGVNLTAIAAVLSVMLRSEEFKELSVTGDAKTAAYQNPGIWKTSILASAAALITVVLIFASVGLVESIYNKIYPRPEVEFGLYDS